MNITWQSNSIIPDLLRAFIIYFNKYSAKLLIVSVVKSEFFYNLFKCDWNNGIYFIWD
jgi:hypothetical protein